MPEPTFLFNTFYSNVLYFNLLFHLTLLNLICRRLLSLPCSGNIFHQTRPYTSYYNKHAELPFSFLFHSIFPQCVFFVKEDLCICALCCICKCITEEVEWTGFAVSYLVSACGFSYEWLTNCFLKSIQGRFFFKFAVSADSLWTKATPPAVTRQQVTAGGVFHRVTLRQ